MGPEPVWLLWGLIPTRPGPAGGLGQMLQPAAGTDSADCAGRRLGDRAVQSHKPDAVVVFASPQEMLDGRFPGWPSLSGGVGCVSSALCQPSAVLVQRCVSLALCQLSAVLAQRCVSPSGLCCVPCRVMYIYSPCSAASRSVTPPPPPTTTTTRSPQTLDLGPERVVDGGGEPADRLQRVGQGRRPADVSGHQRCRTGRAHRPYRHTE